MSMPPATKSAGGAPPRREDIARVRTRAIVLVGLMGAGKTTVGRRLARALDMPFMDADTEIEAAAGCSISEIFDLFGEAEFRNGERKVIARLLDLPPHVLATGGGAFLDPQTRAKIAEKGVSVWLKADAKVLLKRVSRRNHRPLLQNGDQNAIIKRLVKERYPIYAEADITVETGHGPHDRAVRSVIDALIRFHEQHAF
jgi:shikimate kinase